MNKQNKLTHGYRKTDNCQRVGWWGYGKKVKGIKRYKLINKSWTCKEQHREY